MKPAPINFLASTRPLARLLVALAALLLLAGCATSKSTSYRVANIYTKNAQLPKELKRVALLPIAVRNSTETLEEGAEALDPVVIAELSKKERFDVVPVSTEDLRHWTGLASALAWEALPENFFAQIKLHTGCDAVMFCELTRFNAYQPVALGWKFSLVEGSETAVNILWCADATIDAGNPDAADAARTYQSQHIGNEWRAKGHSQILSSPRRFGQFTLCAVFDTLPERKNR